MAWIKVQTTLARSAKMMQFAAVLRMRRREAVGVAVEWFCWVDAQCADGFTGLLPAQVDDVMECKRLAEALLAVGWAFVGADGFLYVQDFDQHHGEGAKARALAAERQARFKAQKGNGGCVTDGNGFGVTGALPRERIYSNNTVVGRDTVVIEAAGVPARTTIKVEDDGFRAWLAGLCGAHPSASKSRVLQNDVLEAARDAYKRVPDALGYVDLLAAYLASKQASDRNKLAFYRPTGQRKFFVDLEDVLCHAERWQREFGWGKKPRKGKTVETPGLQAKRCGGVLVGAEAMAFIRGETDEL
jgi:hypothetical protein